MNRIQPGQSIITVPGDFLRVVQARPSGAADWWDPNGAGLCIWAAYQPKGAASLAASYADLSGNGNNCAPGAAPAWDGVNGWKFNGVTQYLTTTFVAQNDQSQSMIAQITNVVPTGLDYIAGSRTLAAADRFFLSIQAASVIYGNGGPQTVAPTLAAGNMCVAGAQGYRDGAADGGAIGAFGAVPVWPAWIGALNRSGALISPLAFHCQAFAIYDCALTAPQVAAVTAAMAAI